ncbi:unnamed protein product [Urochloa humidicola]
MGAGFEGSGIREEALDHREREVEEAEDALERKAASLKRSELLVQMRKQILDDAVEELSRVRAEGKAELRLQEQKVQENTLGTEDRGI